MNRVRTIFEELIGVSEPVQRRARLEHACEGDAALRREVESLLGAYDASASFLQRPPDMALTEALLDGKSRWFGDYELLEEIGRGGMGVVYRARQVSLNRTVAIKMILAGELAADADVKRFRSEAQAAASLTHPNLVGIYQVGQHQGQQYYTMPLIEGQSLAQLVESGLWRPGDGTEAARVVAKVARAVQHAHQKGILHRDLKPGNILIDQQGEPWITDFGLAKWVKAGGNVTATAHMLGTPSFMAPEQARGRAGHSSVASDIYSLGAVLYYLLTGTPPFVADSALDALLLALESEAVLPRRINPLVSGPLEHICMRCLEKKPEARYASASELALDLERFLKGDSLPVNTKALGRRLEAWARRRPALAARLCTVLLCLGIVVTARIIREYETPFQFYSVIGALVAWLVISAVCQQGVENERHAWWVRYFWSAADPAALTVILFIAEAFHSPLVILYPTVIAASGFWFRASLVGMNTATSLGGYALLLATSPPEPKVHAHWYLLAFVAMVVTGLTVAYLVNRVTALTRFYERRPVGAR